MENPLFLGPSIRERKRRPWCYNGRHERLWFIPTTYFDSQYIGLVSSTVEPESMFSYLDGFSCLVYFGNFCSFLVVIVTRRSSWLKPNRGTPTPLVSSYPVWCNVLSKDRSHTDRITWVLEKVRVEVPFFGVLY